VRSQILALLACGLAGVLACRPAAAQTNSEVQQIPNGSAPHVSLSLHDALALALTNNLDYQSSLADERAAEGQVVQARASLMPSLSGGYSYVHTQTAESLNFRHRLDFRRYCSRARTSTT